MDNTYLECVVLQSCVPSYEVRELLRDKAYAATLIYLQGSPLNAVDLARAHAESASAIFVFCNKFSKNAEEEDAQTILLQYALKRYIMKNSRDSVPKVS